MPATTAHSDVGGPAVADRLTALDTTFLELEEADSSAHMHIGGVMAFEPGPDGPPALDRLREELERRMPLLPRFRQRLSAPRTGGLSWPAWVEDGAFDVGAHVRREALPTPGGHRELFDWAAEFYSHRLDRGRPLWEIVLLEGLEDGGWALACKTHHCLVDGVGSIDMGMALLDSEPPARSGRHRIRDAGPAAEAPSRGSRARRILALGRAGLHLTRHPRELTGAAERLAAVVELVIRDELVAAPATSLNAPIGKRRRYEGVEVSLERVKHVKRALGGTVNDVVLALAAGGLRRLLVERGEPLPATGLRAMVPVNLRSDAERLALGNRVASLFVPLPVAEPVPLRRYMQVMRAVEGIKAGSQLAGAETLLGLTSHIPPVVHSVLARTLFASRLFNVTVTNVPGPQFPLWSLGSRLREIYPLVPLAADHAIGIAVFSYAGSVFFGLNADRQSVPDLHVVAAGISESMEELEDLAYSSTMSATVASARRTTSLGSTTTE